MSHNNQKNHAKTLNEHTHTQYNILTQKHNLIQSIGGPHKYKKN